MLAFRRLRGPSIVVACAPKSWPASGIGLREHVIAAAVLALATGRHRTLHPLAYVFAVLFVVRYALK